MQIEHGDHIDTAGRVLGQPGKNLVSHRAPLDHQIPRRGLEGKPDRPGFVGIGMRRQIPGDYFCIPALLKQGKTAGETGNAAADDGHLRIFCHL